MVTIERTKMVKVWSFAPDDPVPDYLPDHVPVKPSRAAEKVYRHDEDGVSTSLARLMSEARS